MHHDDSSRRSGRSSREIYVGRPSLTFVLLLLIIIIDTDQSSFSCCTRLVARFAPAYFSFSLYLLSVFNSCVQLPLPTTRNTTFDTMDKQGYRRQSGIRERTAESFRTEKSSSRQHKGNPSYPGPPDIQSHSQLAHQTVPLKRGHPVHDDAAASSKTHLQTMTQPLPQLARGPTAPSCPPAQSTTNAPATQDHTWRALGNMWSAPEPASNTPLLLSNGFTSQSPEASSHEHPDATHVWHATSRQCPTMSRDAALQTQALVEAGLEKPTQQIAEVCSVV